MICRSRRFCLLNKNWNFLKIIHLFVNNRSNEHNGRFIIIFKSWLVFCGVEHKICVRFQRNMSSYNSRECASIWIDCVAMKSNHSRCFVSCSVLSLRCNNRTVSSESRLKRSITVGDTLKIHVEQMVQMNNSMILIFFSLVFTKLNQRVFKSHSMYGNKPIHFFLLKYQIIKINDQLGIWMFCLCDVYYLLRIFHKYLFITSNWVRKHKELKWWFGDPNYKKSFKHWLIGKSTANKWKAKQNQFAECMLFLFNFSSRLLSSFLYVTCSAVFDVLCLCRCRNTNTHTYKSSNQSCRVARGTYMLL